MAKAWYAYMGTGEPTDSSNYIRIGIKPDCFCGNEICAIYADDRGLQPTGTWSPNLMKYIADALATKEMQPAKPYYIKKYVYLKDI